MAFNIFKQAIGMLWNNLGDALRVSLIPLLIAFVFTLAAVMIVLGGTGIFSGAVMDDAAAMAMFTSPATWLAAIIIIAVYVVCLAWAAVGWHRYVLLEEKPSGFMPKWHGAEIKSYVGYMVVLFLVAIVVAIAAGIVGSVGALLGPLVVVVFVILAIVMMAIFYCLSIALPSRAIGEKMGLGQSWAAGKPHFKTMLMLAVIVIIFSLVLGLVSGFLGLIPVVGIIVEIVVQWFNTMLGISILTALFGVFVQNRDV